MKILIDALHILSSVFDAFIAYMIVKSVVRAKPDIRLKLLFGAGFIASVFLVNWLNPNSNAYVAALMTRMGENAYNVFRLLFYDIVVIILASVSFRGTITAKLFAAVLYNVILEVGEIFTYGIVILFFPDYLYDTYVNQDAIYLFGFFSSYGYYIVVLLIMRNFPVRSIESLSARQGIMLVAAPTISAVVVTSLVSYLNNIPEAPFTLYLIPALFFMLLLFFIVTFFKSIVDSQEHAKAKAVLGSQIERFAEQYEALESANESLRTFRHDWNNHMLVMRGLVEKNDIEGLGQYIKEIEDASPAFPTAYTGSTTIDALLSGLARKAGQDGIELFVKAVIPSALKIRMADLCVLVSNALDNAYEACQKIAGAPRWIEVHFSYKQGYLYFSVQNSYNAKIVQKDGRIVTDKENAEQHGIGIKNMNTIAEKYGGHISYASDSASFTIKCMLKDATLTD